ncbi:MAG: hypothetical protein KDI50_03775 [Candidatus Competibacteraceae bacterium]|nr:hypothetical protein [Candidatus Competibacteraceae bacterium]
MNLIKTLQPITFHRIFVDITGSINAALMLSQAIYWTNRLKPERDGWFYKTREDWQAETGLTRHEQDKARQRLSALGLLETRRKKVFGDNRMTATWFHIDLARLQEAMDDLDAQGQLPQTGNDQLPVCEDRLPQTGNRTPYKPSITTTTTTIARDFADAAIVADKQQKIVAGTAHETRPVRFFHPIHKDWQPHPATLQQLHREGMDDAFIAAALAEFILFWLESGTERTEWDAAFLRQCRREKTYRQTQETRHERNANRQRPADRPTQQPRGQGKRTMQERNERYRKFIDGESTREDAYDAIPGDFVRH